MPQTPSTQPATPDRPYGGTPPTNVAKQLPVPGSSHAEPRPWGYVQWNRGVTDHTQAIVHVADPVRARRSANFCSFQAMHMHGVGSPIPMPLLLVTTSGAVASFVTLMLLLDVGGATMSAFVVMITIAIGLLAALGADRASQARRRRVTDGVFRRAVTGEAAVLLDLDTAAQGTPVAALTAIPFRHHLPVECFGVGMVATLQDALDLWSFAADTELANDTRTMMTLLGPWIEQHLDAVPWDSVRQQISEQRDRVQAHLDALAQLEEAVTYDPEVQERAARRVDAAQGLDELLAPIRDSSDHAPQLAEHAAAAVRATLHSDTGPAPTA